MADMQRLVCNLTFSLLGRELRYPRAANVRYGSLADIRERISDVRFTPQSGHAQRRHTSVCAGPDRPTARYHSTWAAYAEARTEESRQRLSAIGGLAEQPLDWMLFSESLNGCSKPTVTSMLGEP